MWADMTPEDAAVIAQLIERIAENAVDRRIAEIQGAERAYAWSIGDPNADPAPDDPPPFVVELASRPKEAIISCYTPGSGTSTLDMFRSIDGGTSYQSILQTPVSLASGETFASGNAFKWEDPEDRSLWAPETADTYPMQFQAGDMVVVELDAAAAIKSISMQLRVQRVGEHNRKIRRTR